jgi:hypothetical protein
MQAAITSATPGMIDSLTTQANTSIHSDTPVQSVPAEAQGAYASAGGTATYVTGGSQGTSAPYTVSLYTASSSFVTGVAGGQMTQQPQYVISNPTQIVSPNQNTTASFTPLNETHALTLTVGEIGQIVSTIQLRRSSLQTVKANKTNTINSFTTVSQVISYDATSGWPF